MQYDGQQEKSRTDAGQTLVEFALVVALLLAVLFGIVEFGRLWFYSNHLNNSVRASARYGAVLGKTFTPDLVKQYAEKEITSYIQATPDSPLPGGVEVSVAKITTFGNESTSFAGIKTGDAVKVTATYHFQVLAGSIIPFFSGTRDIRRSASMRFE